MTGLITEISQSESHFTGTILTSIMNRKPKLSAVIGLIYCFYNNQMNARALIGESAMVYCASELMEKSLVF